METGNRKLNLPPIVQAPERLGESCWKAFGKKRAIFLPANSAQAQQYALRFFVTNSWQRKLISLAIRLGFGQKVNQNSILGWLPITHVVVEAKIKYPENCKFAMRQGSTGPYQKISMLAMRENGEPSYYAKIAVGDGADEMVQTEAAILQKLASIAEISNMVPLLLAAGKPANGRAYFITTVAPFLNSKTSFESQHAKFLSLLGHATMQLVPYKHSTEAQYTAEALIRLSSVFDANTYAELTQASQEVLNTIGYITLPTVFAHRDFSPWNIRWHKDGLFVFDWEYGTEGANPLYDFLHFHLIQQVLSKWQFNVIRPKALQMLSPKALSYLQNNHASTNWNAQMVNYLILAYLIDLILFYVDSENKFDASHPVLAAYFSLILKRKQWL